MRRLLLAAAAAIALAVPASAGAVNHAGEYLGGTAYLAPSWTAIPGVEEPAVIDASNASAYALQANGVVKAWGNGDQGELGVGTKEDHPTEAVTVQFPAGTPAIVAIGEAKSEAYAIDATGQGWAWGYNGAAALCIGNAVKQLLPVKVPGVTSAVEVQGGESHVLWRMTDGTVKTCGTNIEGQLGLGEAVKSETTATTIPGLSSIAEVSAGERNGAARDVEGRVFTFGINGNGQAGVGSTAPVIWTPTQVALPGPASQVSVGGDFSTNGSTLVLIEGKMFGWGTDGAGQIGDGGGPNKISPVATGLSFVSVKTGGLQSLGLTVTGEVLGWGSNQGSALGIPTKGNQLTPVLVDTGAVEISATALDSLDR